MSQDRPLDLFWRSWTVPKDGNKPEQNEDAARIEFLPAENGPGMWLIAVADGATEAVYSGLWARTLVAAVAPDWPTLSDDDLNARLNQVRRSFSPIPTGEQVPWYVRNKFLTQGSQATLLPTIIESTGNPDELIIRAIAVGDCCLFLFKGNGEMCAFPVRTSEDFGMHPALVGSRPQTSLDYLRWEARFEPGDVLLACTDAVGKWVLQCVESNQTGLFIDLLLGLLAPAAPESDPSVERSEPPNSGHVNPQPVPAEDSSGIEDREEHPSFLERLQRLIQRLRPQETLSESAETDLLEEDQCTAPESAPAQPLDFSQFIARCRAPESRPRMRNDDATLVVCLPLRPGSNNQQLEVIKILRKHEAAAMQPPATAPATVLSEAAPTQHEVFHHGEE